MSLVLKPTRYAHPEGHTDVCYFTGEKGGLITCGVDGDVRAWVNLMDDDPSASCIAETATTVVAKNEKVYVGNDNNTVQILNHPELEKEGIVTRFAATVCALATAHNSKYIVSGACDMRIQVSNTTDNSDSYELLGHEAPILGLSLDPKDEFVASSGGDGTIRIWSMKDKKSIHIWSNVVPKSNSFFTAKVYGTPSFEPKNGQYLAYPHGKEIIIVERTTWKESFRLKSYNVKNEISICKFSECGTFLAASSVYGEVIVWNFETKETVGYVEHETNAKITSMAWNPKEPNEIAYCDALGQLGCIDVNLAKAESLDMKPKTNGYGVDDIPMSDGDDDDNVISLSKIKASVLDDDDQKSIMSDITSEKKYDEKRVLPEINLQEPFQPGSTPDHLISRYMMWNDVGIIMRFNSEDEEEGNIEVNFHDVMVHHSMHISNFAGHTMAALSAESLVLAAPRIDEKPSKLVVVALQATGNKEWTVDLPDEEEVQAVAAGTTFVAAATNARTLRLFMPGGTQREVISIPGPVVAMNALGNNLSVVYHSSIAFGDQILSLSWIRICGPNLKSHTLRIPLSPGSTLMWVGFSDLGSPVILDSEGIINMYDKKAALWRVACNTNRHKKGKFDHYFIIGVSESEGLMRCILCKGSHYPPTTPRPIVGEVPLTIPLCDPESKKSESEVQIWRPGNNPVKETKAILALIVEACRQNVEYRALEICQQIAPQKVLELAVRYCGHQNRHALASKLEKIADSKESDEASQQMNTQEDIFNDRVETVEDDQLLLIPTKNKAPDVVIKPLTPSQSFGRRNNPWVKKGNTPTSKGVSLGLSGLDNIEKNPPKPATPATVHPSKKEYKKVKDAPKESFISWLQKNQPRLKEAHPKLENAEFMKMAYTIFKEELHKTSNTNGNVGKPAAAPEEESKKRKLSDEESNKEKPVVVSEEESKKRKLGDDDSNDENQPKRSTSSKLSAFARTE